ncbi:MAG: hypothetical protein QG613_789 [Pseudomonadota bacterium]|nr:hypothetical protein [Pseudomonadota bacterium]
MLNDTLFQDVDSRWGIVRKRALLEKEQLEKE